MSFSRLRSCRRCKFKHLPEYFGQLSDSLCILDGLLTHAENNYDILVSDRGSRYLCIQKVNYQHRQQGSVLGSTPGYAFLAQDAHHYTANHCLRQLLSIPNCRWSLQCGKGDRTEQVIMVMYENSKSSCGPLPRCPRPLCSHRTPLCSCNLCILQGLPCSSVLLFAEQPCYMAGSQNSTQSLWD